MTVSGRCTLKVKPSRVARRRLEESIFLFVLEVFDLLTPF
jgi:hypothetical protein